MSRNWTTPKPRAFWSIVVSARLRTTATATWRPRWRILPASFAIWVQPLIAEPDRSNPHPRSGLGRSKCDPIRIRPRPLHLKAEQRDQVVPDDDRDVRFAGLILAQLLGLVGIRILSCGRDQMFPSEAKPHIIEKEQGARLQQPYCCDGSRQIDIDRMAPIEINDIKSLSIPGQLDQVNRYVPEAFPRKVIFRSAIPAAARSARRSAQTRSKSKPT